jgi:calcineurin-like phosphoesterase family protein
MTIHLVSKTCFGQANPTEDARLREDMVLRHWQERVSEDDLVIHLGDVLETNASFEESSLPLLPGTVLLTRSPRDAVQMDWAHRHLGWICVDEFLDRHQGRALRFSHYPSSAKDHDLNIVADANEIDQQTNPATTTIRVFRDRTGPVPLDTWLTETNPRR